MQQTSETNTTINTNGQNPVLNEKDRVKLDGIVQKMIQNGESDENIKFVVNDFKQK